MVDFPYSVGWQGVTFQVAGNSTSGGFGLSGASINTASNSGHWRATASFVVRTEDQYLGWQGFLAEMRGTVGTTLVPCKSKYLPFDAVGRRLNGSRAVDFGSTSVWDTTGLAQSDLTHAELEADAALRDGYISVRYIDTQGLRPGHFLTIGENLHRVISASETAADVAQVQIEPLLRAPFLAGERVVIDKPHCRMRFASTSEGVIDQTLTRINVVSARFVEDVS